MYSRFANRLFVAATALALMTGAANAATTFTFNHSGSAVQSEVWNVGGIGLTTTAGVFNDSTGNVVLHPSVLLTLNGGYGYGVHSPGESFGSPDHQIDGSGYNELVVLAFDKTVRLVSATFNFVERDDDFSFLFGGIAPGVMSLISNSADIPGTGNNRTYTFAQNWTGMLFGIGANGNDDEFKLKSITVEAVSEVPVPAALPLLASGLLAAGVVGRRKRKAAAKA